MIGRLESRATAAHRAPARDLTAGRRRASKPREAADYGDRRTASRGGRKGDVPRPQTRLPGVARLQARRRCRHHVLQRGRSTGYCRGFLKTLMDAPSSCHPCAAAGTAPSRPFPRSDLVATRRRRESARPFSEDPPLLPTVDSLRPWRSVARRRSGAASRLSVQAGTLEKAGDVGRAGLQFERRQERKSPFVTGS